MGVDVAVVARLAACTALWWSARRAAVVAAVVAAKLKKKIEKKIHSAGRM
jgi:hypothetical protein